MNELIKIKDVSTSYGVTTRSLRYYEDMGLIQSIRGDDYAYRMYDETAIKRLQQILILRKLNISIKDIKRIFEKPGAEIVLEILREKVDDIDDEIALLHELKQIVLDFIAHFNQADFSKDSDVKLLYDKAKEIETQIVNVDYNGNPSNKSDVEKLLRLIEKQDQKSLNLRIVEMRPMRVLSNYLKGTNRMELHSEEEFDVEYKRIMGKDYKHYHAEHFEGHSSHMKGGYIITRRIPNDCVNNGPYEEYILGGLFVAESTKPDIEPGELWKTMTKALNESTTYEIDDIASGGYRDSIYGCNGDLLGGDFAYWECLIPVKKVK